MPNTTTSILTTNITGAYDKRLLDRLVPKFYHVGYGESRPVPSNQGATITLRRYGNLTAATTALIEGVTPSGSVLSKTDLTITCAQYGDYITLTDWLDMTGLDPKVIRPLDILGDQAGDTHDQLARNAMIAGTQVVYSANQTGRAYVDDKIKNEHVAWAVNLLRRTSVDFITEKVGMSTQVASQPIDAGYVFLGHVDLDADIRALTGFIATRFYAQPGRALPGEIGSVGYVRFVLTPNAKIFAPTGTVAKGSMRGTTYADVYASILFGKGYYANSQIGSNSTKTIIKTFGAAGTNDPLDQRSTVGWKSTYGAGILDDRRGVRFETGATAGAAANETSAGVGAGSPDTTLTSFFT